MEEFSDDQLVRKAKQGDLEAYTELARRYQEKIYRTIMGMTRNHQDADDLAQETFMQAYKALKKFKQQSGFYTWLYRIAVNLTLNFLKRAGREKSRKDIELETLTFDELTTRAVSKPEKDKMLKDFRKKLQDTIAVLPLVYRTSFLLVELEGMSHKQAAAVLNCSENTISWRMHKARKMLQAKLQPYWDRGII